MMKIFLYTLLLALIPFSAMACLDAPEQATKEQIARVAAPYHGFEVKIISVDTKVSSLPHDGFTARADVLSPKGKTPPQINLVFGPCSLIPETGTTYYFIAKSGMARGYYEVIDQPSSVIKY